MGSLQVVTEGSSKPLDSPRRHHSHLSLFRASKMGFALANNALGGGPSPFNPPIPVGPGLLTGQRRVLIEALRAKSPKSERVVEMYSEALRAIQRNDGPEALHTAAYEIREFMRALPAALDLPVVLPVQIQDKANGLAKHWEACTIGSKCLQGGEWDGAIDEPLRRFLARAVDFFKWMVEEVPNRQKETAIVLQRLLPAAFPMPKALMDRRLTEWKRLLRYFNAILHHNEVPTFGELAGRLEELETFLLEHLTPRTFSDQDAIDRLIEEAETP